MTPSRTLISGDGVAALLGLVGTALAVISFSLDMYGGAPGMGRSEELLLYVSAGLFAGATALKFARRENLADLVRFLLVSFQLLLLAVVINRYEILDVTFHKFLIGLAVSGFFGNYFLPKPARPAFFLLLSFAAMFGVFGPVLGSLMLVVGAGIIAICHLPLSLWIRVALLLAVAVFFAVVRIDTESFPLLAGLLPILPSIFMFRLLIYLYDSVHGKAPIDWPSRFSYFFMLPNFVFPFYPVVDSAQWRRSYYSAPELETYQAGVRWIFYGVIHLILYRFVNYYLAMDPTTVDGFIEFLKYAAFNFALYLKVSGLFHLILGLLHLFGYHLPETHSRYYFSFSFIEFWRRINIYWKDFMQKMVFNPVFAWVKSRGARHMQAIVAAIAAVFFVTWALHAYQWFWLRGGLFLNIPDTLFWTILCVMLIVQTVEESRPAVRGAKAMIGPRTLRVVRTVAMMTFLVILWAMWSSASLEEWTSLLAAAGFVLLDPHSEITLTGAVQSLAFAGFLFVLAAISAGFTFGLAPRGSHPVPRKEIGRKKDDRLISPDLMILVCSCAVLLALTLPALRSELPRTAQKYVADMQGARLSALDQERLERGYYENLTGLSLTNSELWNHRQSKPANWLHIEEEAIARVVDGYLGYELIPNMTIVHRGAILSTNDHGMHDHNYEVAKPAGTLRIALIGASRGMGSSVEMQETFENLLEEELNASLPMPVEILNFAYGGYDGVRKLMVLEQKAAKFDPDIVIFVTHQLDVSVRWRFSRYAGKGPMPFEFLDQIVEDAGVTGDMSRGDITRRLEPFTEKFADRIYQRLESAARDMGAQPIVVFLPSINTEFEAEALGTMRGAVRLSRVPLIDLENVFESENKSSIVVAPWDDHPNPRGHQIIARAIYDRLTEMEEFKDVVSGF
jgi:hypothetical protein